MVAIVLELREAGSKLASTFHFLNHRSATSSEYINFYGLTSFLCNVAFQDSGYENMEQRVDQHRYQQDYEDNQSRDRDRHRSCDNRKRRHSRDR